MKHPILNQTVINFSHPMFKTGPIVEGGKLRNPLVPFAVSSEEQQLPQISLRECGLCLGGFSPPVLEAWTPWPKTTFHIQGIAGTFAGFRLNHLLL